MQTSKIWATVVEVDQVNRRIKVKFDNGQSSNKGYRYPKSGYVPVIGDRAIFEGQICLGIY